MRRGGVGATAAAGTSGATASPDCRQRAPRMSTQKSSPGAPIGAPAVRADGWGRQALRIPAPATNPAFTSVLEADQRPGNISVTKRPLNTSITALRYPRKARSPKADPLHTLYERKCFCGEPERTPRRPEGCRIAHRCDHSCSGLLATQQTQPCQNPLRLPGSRVFFDPKLAHFGH